VPEIALEKSPSCCIPAIANIGERRMRRLLRQVQLGSDTNPSLPCYTLLCHILLYSTLPYPTQLNSTLLYSTALSVVVCLFAPYITVPYPTLIYSSLLISVHDDHHRSASNASSDCDSIDEMAEVFLLHHCVF
jgi:hypothetical protein